MAVELYKHNKKAYENVVEHFKTTNRTCVIHPTGSGKSFISLKYIDDNKNNNILILAPTYPILDQFNKNIAKDILNVNVDELSQEEINSIVASRLPNLNFSIYSNVSKIANQKFDNIIMDEFHRVGAEVWGLGVNNLLDNNKEAKVLGVTATPIRYLDDFRDMSEEIFNGDISSEITLAQAIAWGILPAPTYVSALYSFDEKLDKIEKKINNYKDPEKKQKLKSKLQEARKTIEKSEGLSQVFGNHINKTNGKYIVFCRNIEHMKRMEEEAKKWFESLNENISITEVHTYNDRIVNQESISNFEKDNSSNLKLLFSIQMLNEGLHVDDIDGVIMLRPTTSPIIYLQQLGRALSVGHNSNPLVFDIVNNYEENLEIYNLYKDVQDELNKIKGGVLPPFDITGGFGGTGGIIDVDDMLKKFKIFDDMLDLKKQLKLLDDEASFGWDDNYELAKNFYEKNGHLNIPINYRTFDGITEVKPKDPEYENAIQLGMWIHSQRQAKNGYGTRKKLTDEQIKLLNEIGMVWNTKDYQWMNNYELAKKFYEVNGHLNIPLRYRTFDGITEVKPGDHEYENAVQLGYWISNQRRYRNDSENNKYPQERIDLLDEIGMVWVLIDNSWYEKYELAQNFYEKNGHLNIPVNYRTFDGITEVKPDDPEYENAIKLGGWISRQRQARKGVGNSTINDEQIALLDEIGMIWNQKEDTWLPIFELAQKFYEKNGHLNIPVNYRTFDGITEVKPGDSEYKNAVQLGQWIQKNRKLKNTSTDDPIILERIRMLDEIGMVWSLLNVKWMDNYELAQKFYEVNGHLNIPLRYRTFDGITEVKPGDHEYENAVQLGQWISNQRRYRADSENNKYPQERIDLLDEIGMVWEYIDTSWDDKYSLAKNFYKTNGHLNIPSKYRTFDGITEVKPDDPEYENAVQLGQWISTQRTAFKGKNGSTISPMQIKKLDEIGMLWFANEAFDNKSQREIVTEKNSGQKRVEIYNRFLSTLNTFKDEQIPSKDELNQEFIDQLNHTSKKR